MEVGKHTYTSAQNGKYFNINEELLDGLIRVGQLVPLDNAFPTIQLLQAAKRDGNITAVATQVVITKHFPEKHVRFQ